MKKTMKRNMALLLAAVMFLCMGTVASAEQAPAPAVYFCDTVFGAAALQAGQRDTANGPVYTFTAGDGLQELSYALLNGGDLSSGAAYAAAQADVTVIACGMEELLVVLDNYREDVLAGRTEKLLPAVSEAAERNVNAVSGLCDALLALNPAAELLVVGVYNPFPETGEDALWNRAAAVAVPAMNDALAALTECRGLSYLCAEQVETAFICGEVATGTGTLADLMYGAALTVNGADTIGALVSGYVQAKQAEPVQLAVEGGKQGNLLELSYSVMGNHGFDAADFTLEYDRSALNLLSVESTVMGDGLRLNGDGEIRYAGDGVYENGGLFTAVFVVTGESAADSSIICSMRMPDGSAAGSASYTLQMPGQQLPETYTVTVDISGLPANVMAEADGVPCDMDLEGSIATVYLPDEKAETLTMVEYHEEGGDENLRYPVGMYVWRLHCDGAVYSAQRLSGLDHVLQYAGISVAAGESTAFRMLSAMPEDTRAALTGSGELKAVEYGTLAGFGSGTLRTGTAMVRDTVYLRGSFDWTERKDGMSRFSTTLSQIGTEAAADSVTYRPYLILEDADGEQFTVYGGEVTRTVGYLAWRNRNAFAADTAEYANLQALTEAAYGGTNPYAA